MRAIRTSYATSLLLGALSCAHAAWAPIVSGNSPGVQYIAVLPDKNDTSVRGVVQISSNSNGTGTAVQVSISGLPAQGGPYPYHIHQYPVPAQLDCGKTGGHFDPYNASDVICDMSQPDKCQIGDLSGKHGNMTSSSYSANYVDLYISTQPNTLAFTGNLSIVVHFANGTRITCANFTSPDKGSASPSAAVSTAQAPGFSSSAATSPSSSQISAQVSLVTSTAIVTSTQNASLATASDSGLITTLVPSTIYNTLMTSTVILVSSVVQQLQTVQNVTYVPSLATPPRTSSRNSTMAIVTGSMSVPSMTPNLTSTATVVSMVYIVPQPTLQTVSTNMIITTSSNQTATNTVLQPYTSIGTSTLIQTVVQPAAQILTIPTITVQSGTISPSLQAAPVTSTITQGLAAAQTVYTTILSTITLAPGQSMPSQSVVTITSQSQPGLTITNVVQAGSTITASPSASIFTMTSSNGNLLSTIRSYIFGAPTVTLTAPTTITATAIQTVVPNVVTQVIQALTQVANPAVATVVNVVSLAPSALTKPGSLLTTLLVQATPVTSVLSVITANNLVSTVTQPLGVLPSVKVTSTTILNVGVPIVGVAPPSTTTIPRITNLVLPTKTTTIRTSLITITPRIKTTTILPKKRPVATEMLSRFARATTGEANAAQTWPMHNSRSICLGTVLLFMAFFAVLWL